MPLSNSLEELIEEFKFACKQAALESYSTAEPLHRKLMRVFSRRPRIKICITYDEILETVAVHVFNKLAKDSKLRKRKNIHFYRPKKKELFEYLYQTELTSY